LLVLLGQSGARDREDFVLPQDVSYEGGHVAVRDSDCPDDAVAQDVQSAAFVAMMKVARTGQPGTSSVEDPDKRSQTPQDEVQTSGSSLQDTGNGTNSTTERSVTIPISLPQVQLLKQQHHKVDGHRKIEHSKTGTDHSRVSKPPSQAKASITSPQAELPVHQRHKRRAASMLTGASSSASANKAQASTDSMEKGTADDILRAPGRGLYHWFIDARSHKDIWLKLKCVTLGIVGLICIVGTCLLCAEKETSEATSKIGEDDNCEYGDEHSAGKEHGEDDGAGKELGEADKEEDKMDGEKDTKPS